jgi:hypothetical protein
VQASLSLVTQSFDQQKQSSTTWQKNHIADQSAEINRVLFLPSGVQVGSQKHELRLTHSPA